MRNNAWCLGFLVDWLGGIVVDGVLLPSANCVMITPPAPIKPSDLR